MDLNYAGRRRQLRIPRRVFIDRDNPFNLDDEVFFTRYRFPKVTVMMLISELESNLKRATHRSKAIPVHLIVSIKTGIVKSVIKK